MLTKLIFLDVDGVINAYDYMHATTVTNEESSVDQWHMHWFDPRTELWLKYIIRETGAKIVVSSTWRGNKNFDKMWESRHMPDVVIGKTPKSPCRFRGVEIRQWMEAYGLDKIHSYLILDDDRDMLPEQIPHFLWTNGEFGITMVEARKGIEILNNPPVPDQWLFRSPDL